MKYSYNKRIMNMLDLDDIDLIRMLKEIKVNKILNGLIKDLEE